MKNIKSIEEFSRVNESTLTRNPRVQQGYYAREMQAQLPVEIMAMIKVANPGMPYKELAKTALEVLSKMGIAPTDAAGNLAASTVPHMFRHMDKDWNYIDNMPEGNQNEYGLKYMAMVAREAYDKAGKKISDFRDFWNRAGDMNPE